MSFANPYWLLLLLALPPLVWWEFRSMRRGGPSLRFSSLGLVSAADPSWRVQFRAVPRMLRVGALCFGIVALARPQEHNVVVERSAEGIDIILVLDTSTSMRARDFHPNRFEAARDVAAEFVRNRVSDRVGLIVFAGKAYTQAPLTIDYPFLLTMLEEVRMGIVEDGTAIGNALAMAVNRLTESEAESKVVILLTDGQNNRGEIDPLTAADLAQAMGARVYTVGVGAREGAADDLRRGLSPPSSPATLEIDEESLRHIADATGGRYFHAGDKEALRSVYAEIDELEKTEISESTYTEYGERFAYFLWPAFGLLLLEALLSSTVLRIWP